MTIPTATFQTIFHRSQSFCLILIIIFSFAMICVEIFPQTTENYSVLDKGEEKEVVLTKHLYKSGFAVPNAELCSGKGNSTRLLILVASAPANFKSRQAIRLTWGTYGRLRFDVRLAFVLGESSGNATIQKKIKSEQYFYNDLIIGKFNDTYDNLTLKTMACLEWIGLYCGLTEFVMKTDDDMFINVPNLLYLIKNIEKTEKHGPKVYGRVGKKWEPRRGKSGKYYISFEQYEDHRFPDFTTGPAYLFSGSIVPFLFDMGMELPYIKLEDVYTTGIVAKSLGIQRVNIPELQNKPVDINETEFCELSKLISIHNVSFEEQFEIWKRVLTGDKTNCNKILSQVESYKLLKQIKF